MIRILHIAADFPNQDLYPRLVESVARNVEVTQTVLSAVRSKAEADVRMPAIPRVRYEIRHILRPAHRLFFRSKIRLIARTAAELDGFADTQVVHAHSLYSDGAAALALWRSHRLPYLAAVRNVDLHAFMRLRPDLAFIRDAVLRHASAIVFLSPAYRRIFLARLATGLAREVEAKSEVIPNGVAQYWLDNPPGPKAASDDALRLLYVGDMSANKNIRGILVALGILCRTIRARLTVVGGNLEEARAAGLRFDESLPVRFEGRITDRQRLRELYRQHDVFVMPSFTETFGIAYVEALSQGLPVVHSRDQGIAGYFEPQTVAEPVDPGNAADIARGILALADRCEASQDRCVAAARAFDWSSIGPRYVSLYEGEKRCPAS